MQYYVISIFVFISLLCTGFASWVTVGLTAGSASGSIFTAYQSVNTEDYVQLEGIECFDYCDLGFVIDNALSDEAYVTVTYSFDGATINQSYGHDFTLQLTLSGTQSDKTTPISLFSTAYLPVYKVTIGSTDVTKQTTRNTTDESGEKIIIELTGDSVHANHPTLLGTDNQTLTVTYTFEYPSSNFAYFYSQIKPANSGATSSFNAHAKLLI